MKRVLTIVLLIIAFTVIIAAPFFIWGGEKFTFFSDQEKAITAFILVTLEFVSIIFSIVIVVYVLYQYIRYRRPHRLVFEAFSNESELVQTENKPLNLSMLAQEELVRQFKVICNELGEYTEHADNVSQDFEAFSGDGLYLDEDLSENNIGTYVSVDQIKKSGMIEDLKIVIEDLKDPKGINLMNLVGEIAPKEVTPFMKFIEAIIPPHIIRATGHLQWWSDVPGKVGITFEFVDIGSQRNLMVRTIWWRPSEKKGANEASINGELSNQGKSALSKEEENALATDRYIDLLRPAMHWLALMFWEQELMSHVPIQNHFLKLHEKRRKARILYLLGAMYYAHSDQFQAYSSFFCQLAVEHFRQSSITDPNWNLSYLYLANLYSFKVLVTKEEKSEKLLKEALSLYEKALAHTKETHTRSHIIIAKALAKLSSGITSKNVELMNWAIKDVEELKKEIDPADFDPTRADCAVYLYNLATWYSLAYDHYVSVPNVEPKEEARCYLAYALTRSRTLWHIVEKDGNFDGLRKEGDVKELIEILKESLDINPELANMTGQPFKTEIHKILQMVDEKLERPGTEVE